MRTPLRTLRLSLACTALALPAGATWSIVAVNPRTGEVAVASATCLVNTNLESSVPALLVGLGGGAAQSAGDPTGELRQIMVQGFKDGLASQEILALIEASGVGNLEAQQFGIVSLVGAPATRTGSQNGRAALGVTGEIDGIEYAIQGNVLAGNKVVKRCEIAFRQAAGDLSQRVMAAMEEARAFGGDGRCSCSQRFPTSCGSPPPEFEKAAHVGFVVVARMGDTDGGCDAGGCASGRYWLDLNVVAGAAAQDPVITLRNRYDAFRSRHVGKPDGTLSTVEGVFPALPADGRTGTSLELVLRDVDGVPLDHGGANVTAAVAAGDEDVASVLGVQDLGDGRYRVDVRAGTLPGRARLLVHAQEGNVDALLFPFPTVEVEPVTPLFCGFDVVDPAVRLAVPLILNVPAAGGAPYVVVASASGTTPGVPFAGGLLPLNPDRFFGLSRAFAGGPSLPGTLGLLDADGHAEGAFVTPPTWAAGLLGTRLDWAALVFTRPPQATNADGFDLLLPPAAATAGRGPGTR